MQGCPGALSMKSRLDDRCALGGDGRCRLGAGRCGHASDLGCQKNGSAARRSNQAYAGASGSSNGHERSLAWLVQPGNDARFGEWFERLGQVLRVERNPSRKDGLPVSAERLNKADFGRDCTRAAGRQPSPSLRTTRGNDAGLEALQALALRPSVKAAGSAGAAVPHMPASQRALRSSASVVPTGGA